MNNINSIFRVKFDQSDPSTWEDQQVEGHGQEACSAIMNKYKGQVIIFMGFHRIYDNKFIPSKVK